jgi:hypothetical protein
MNGLGAVNLDNVYVPTEDGQFVSEKHARIAEMVQDYDPSLRLAWIPDSRRKPGDAPFAVIENREGRDMVVFYADECDERIIARIFAGDNAKGNVQVSMEVHNDAIRAYQAKKAKEEAAEAHEKAHSILRSPKSTYKMRDERGELRTYR